MNSNHSVSMRSLLLAASLLIAVFVAPSVCAQEAPTPVPEPAAPAEPAAAPEAPAEPADAPEEPAAPAEPAEPAAPAAAAAPAPAPPPVPEQAKVPMVYRDKTRITVDGRAEMDGVIELGVKLDGSDAKKVRVNIIKKTKKKKITKALVEQFVFTLGDGYNVKQTNDQTIRIEAKKKNPPVAIWLLTQNLSGVSIMVGNG